MPVGLRKKLVLSQGIGFRLYNIRVGASFVKPTLIRLYKCITSYSIIQHNRQIQLNKLFESSCCFKVEQGFIQDFIYGGWLFSKVREQNIRWKQFSNVAIKNFKIENWIICNIQNKFSIIYWIGIQL